MSVVYAHSEQGSQLAESRTHIYAGEHAGDRVKII
jgi:hypothetical protein